MDSTSTQLDSSKIHLRGIDINNFNVCYSSNDEFLFQWKEDVEHIELQHKSYTRLNLEQNMIGFGVTLEVRPILKDGRKPNAKLQAEILAHFIVENLSHFVVDKQNRFLVSENLGEVLSSITYSTLRGIIFEKSNGTKFDKLILPIINPRELFKHDIQTL